MKKIILFAAAALMLAGCNKDKDIVPSDVEAGSSRFEFPQAGTPADVQEIFDDIYERFGTKVIYKDFTERDMNRGWLAPGTGTAITYSWDFITDPAKLKRAAGILRDKVLGGLPAEKMRPVMQGVQYIFLTDNLKSTQTFGPGNPPQVRVLALYPTTALDGMGLNLQLDAANDNRTYAVYFPALIVANLVDRAFNSGIFTVPKTFSDEVNLIPSEPKISTRVSYVHSHDGIVHDGLSPVPQDYWAQHGLIPTPTTSGMLGIGKHSYYNHYSNYPAFISPNIDASDAFLYMCMDPNWRSFGAEAGTIDYTLTGIYHDTRLFRRLEILSAALKEQGVDVEAICTKLYAGTNLYTSPDKIYISGVTPASENPLKYIYSDSK